MSPDYVHDKFMAILTPYLSNKSLLDSMTDDTHLTADLKINSAHVVDIVIDAELEFDILIDNDSIERMTTVGSCVALISQKLLADVSR
jgi:acyl carrier protein